jgi:hypothetical protein
VLHKLAAMPGSQLQLAVWQNCGEKQQRHMCCTIAKHFSMLHVELTTSHPSTVARSREKLGKDPCVREMIRYFALAWDSFRSRKQRAAIVVDQLVSRVCGVLEIAYVEETSIVYSRRASAPTGHSRCEHSAAYRSPVQWALCTSGSGW